MPAAGGTPRNLTAALDRGIEAGAMAPGAAPARLHWSPDGGSLIARVHDRSAIHLYRIDAVNGGTTVIAGGRRVVESFSVARDGAIAASVADHTHPAEVFLINMDGQERRLTGINDELCAGLRLPTIEPLSVTLADGAIMEGWVIKPPNLEPGKQYPLVLDVHGGPHGAFQYNFRLSYPFLLAAQGCAVL
ncbi:MAG: S9 family peptidase [Dehalococcoidia bacterium]